MATDKSLYAFSEEEQQMKETGKDLTRVHLVSYSYSSSSYY